jgi:hypothetical protein
MTQMLSDSMYVIHLNAMYVSVDHAIQRGPPAYTPSITLSVYTWSYTRHMKYDCSHHIPYHRFLLTISFLLLFSRSISWCELSVCCLHITVIHRQMFYKVQPLSLNQMIEWQAMRQKEWLFGDRLSCTKQSLPLFVSKIMVDICKTFAFEQHCCVVKTDKALINWENIRTEKTEIGDKGFLEIKRQHHINAWYVDKTPLPC